MNLWLSAGKDSRIVLAYAIKNNLNFTALTSGYEESPEVQCASDMCSILHVSHIKKLTLKDNTPNNRNYIDELAYHAGRHDSSLAPTAGHNKPITGNTNKAIIGGFGGELYRKGENPFHRTHKFETIEDAMKHWENYHVKRDVLNVMNKQILNAHKIKLANWAREQYEKNIPLKALPELFWIKYRYPYHHGIAMNGYGFDTRLDPLYQKEIINIHLQDEYENGMYGRTNFELLVRANKFLVEFPYVNDTWHPQLLPKIQEYSNTREQINMNFQKYQNKMYQDKILRPQTWNLLQNCRQELKTLFATNSELYEIVDRNKIERLLERETINEMSEINQFLSIISLQLTLTGQVRRSKDVNVEHRKSKITTNTFALLPSS